MDLHKLRLTALEEAVAVAPAAKVAALLQVDECGKPLYRLRLIGNTPMDDTVQFGDTPEKALEKFVASIHKRFTPNPHAEDD